MSEKIENGYMQKVMETLKEGEYRQFPLDEVNVFSWRTVTNRVNKRLGYLRYSVSANKKLGFMAIKCNKKEK